MKRESFIAKKYSFTFHVSHFSLPIDPYLLLVWLFILPAITPLIQPTLTRSADGLLHLYRLIALDHTLVQGVLFPRWWPDLAYGYGLPLFVYYAPLSYYLAESLHLLGLSNVSAFNAAFALALVAAGTGTYLWVKNWLGPAAGLLAGLAYVYAPYQLYNVMLRGSLPIAWAGALMPFALWAFGRLLRTDRPGDLPLAAGATAATLLAHNISSLLFLPLLVLYLVAQLAAQPAKPAQLQQAGRVALALGLGLALAAFFLVPAMLEQDFIQVKRVITPPDFDYHFNFVSLAELVALPSSANTGLLNPKEPFSLGLFQAGLGSAGLLLGFYRLRTTAGRVQLGITAIALAGLVFFMLPISVGVWDRLPFLAFVQQPHRLLSPAALLLAALAGAAVTEGRRRDILAWLGAALIVISAIPLLYPRYYTPLPAAPDLAGMMAYERATGTIGTTSFGEYLPVTVRQVPTESPLEPLYQAGRPIERLDRAYLPVGAEVETALYGFNRAELSLNSPEPYQAVFTTFYFPGWLALVDGRPAPIAPVTERGLIGVSMPAGQHSLLLYFTETPLRQAANWLSTLALLGLLILTGRAIIAGNRQPTADSRQPTADGHWPITIHNSQFIPQGYPFGTIHYSQFIAPLLLALVLLGGKIAYIDSFDTPFKRVFDGQHVAGSQVARFVNFGGQVNMLGYDFPRQEVVSGQAFDLTIYWQVRQPLAANYSALVQLVDDQGHLYAGQDNLHPGNLPTSRWEPWGFVRDSHPLQVPAGTPPGHYFLVTGLYNPVTWVRLPVIEGGDLGWADVIALPVTVQKPAFPAEPAQLDMAWPASQEFGPALRLLGATPERQSIRRNDFLRVALFWEALAAPLPDYQIELRLVTDDGTIYLAESARPSYGRYPTPHWTPGERVRDNHALAIPGDLPAGMYHLQVAVRDENGQPIKSAVEVGHLPAEE